MFPTARKYAPFRPTPPARVPGSVAHRKACMMERNLKESLPNLGQSMEFFSVFADGSFPGETGSWVFSAGALACGIGCAKPNEVSPHKDWSGLPVCMET